MAPCRPVPVARGARDAARRGHAPEWSTPNGIRSEGAGWCGPIIMPAKHLQPMRVGQKVDEAGPGCAQFDDSVPVARSPDATSPCAPERIIDLHPTVLWCVDRFGKTPTFPGNFLYGRVKNCRKLNVSLVFLSTRCGSVI